ncbi:MAG: spore germination protein, partial [Clostridia bacterium]|nr:spore germination protein [Clostridia bacterium]
MLSGRYDDDVALLDGILKSGESFDLLKRKCAFGNCRETFFYIEGFVAGEMMQKIMTYLTSCADIGAASALAAKLPAVEASACSDERELATAVLSGKSVMMSSSFGAAALIIDSRSYPARDATEPENDRVLRGSRDGFVETLIFNTAMVRRRIRSEEMRVEYARAGESTRCDVALCYMKSRVDKKLLEKLRQGLSSLDTDSVALGHESVAECLIKKRWYDPFPKFRLTERPDVAAASVLEGSVVLLVDNSPEAMLFPTSLFDFLQEADDYYFPPF